MAVACAGYRTSGIGHHQTTFEAAEMALGTSSAALTAYFEGCRRKRNNVDYDRASVTTETEAQEIVKKVHALLALTENWISQNYPVLV